MVEVAPIARAADGGALDPVVGPQCSLAVQLRRATGAVIGRSAELDAISQELREASGRLAAVTLEGEPGIGKTRLLLAAVGARDGGRASRAVAITADEEIRGPFLVARSLFAVARDPGRRRRDAGRDRRPPRRRGHLRAGRTRASRACRRTPSYCVPSTSRASRSRRWPRIRPLALLIDDVQWADDDTLRLLRYVVRSDADRPIFLFLTIRPDEFASVTEAVNFVADMERMGLVRRLRPGRFSSVETAELLKRVLGGPVEAASAAAMHVQSEGVPFIVEELARTHREAGTLQQIDGDWRLGRNAARLVPSAVRTLIDRRAARLPARTRGRARRRRDPRPELQPARPPGDPGPSRRRRDCAGGGVPRPAPDAQRDAAGAGDGADPLADDLAPAVARGPPAAAGPGRARGLHVHPRTGPPVRGEPAVGGRVAGRSMRPSSTCSWRAATRPRPDCRCSPSTRSRPATRRAPRASRSMPRRPPSSPMPPRRRFDSSSRHSRSCPRPPTGASCSRPATMRSRSLRRTGERLDGLTELAALAEAMRDPAVELDVSSAGRRRCG